MYIRRVRAADATQGKKRRDISQHAVCIKLRILQILAKNSNT